MKRTGFGPTLLVWWFRRPAIGGIIILATMAIGLYVVQAAFKDWNNTGTDFNTSGNWTGGTPTSTDVARFNTAQTTQPNLSSSLAIQGLAFGAAGAGYDLTSSSTAIKLTLTNVGSGASSAINAANTSGTNTIDAPLVLGGASVSTHVITQSGSGGALVINGVISSTNSPTLNLTPSGNSSITVNGTNTYTGATTLAGASINANTILAVGNDSAFSTGTLTLMSGITITAVNGARNIANATTWSANGTIGGSNHLNFSGSFTSSNSNTRTITVNNSGTSTLSGNVFLSESNTNARVLTMNGSGVLDITGVITNNSGANTLGSGLTLNSLTGGTLRLFGANTYTGATTLSAGTLVLGNKTAFGNGGTVAWNGVSTSANTNLSGANAIANTSTLGASGNVFTGSNSLELSGSITNSVAGTNTVTNNMSAGTLTLSGTVNLSNNATAKTLAFNGSGNTTISGVIANGGGSTSNLAKSGAGSLTLSNTNTYTGTTAVSAGTLLVNGSTAAASAVTVSGTGILGGTGTVNGSVTVNSGGSVAPGASPGILNTGTVAFSSGSTYSVEIGGTTPGNTASNHDQLNVTGSVSPNGATLSLASFGGFTPMVGQSFVIINNDGSDPITTTFAGLAEGATTPNFLGSGLSATITYAGGTNNNDVVLSSVAAPCTPPSTVYVDDSWASTQLGDDPDMGGPATSFGCDSFATIQGGVNGVATSGTVNVAAGSYVENITIPKALTLTGAGAGSVFVYPALSAPNTCAGASLCPGGSNIMLVQANNVTISGLTLDGDNTSLTSIENFGGANIDARNGIITNHPLGTFNNLEVHHTTVKNIYLRGMYASSGGTFNFHDNTVQNVQASAASIGMFNFAGAGAYTNNNVSACNDAISSNHSRGTTYTGNTVINSASGIHSDNAGDSGGTPDTIANNTVTNSQVNGYGIWVFVPYKTVTVQNNTVTNTDVGHAVFGDSGVTTTTRPEKGEREVVAAGRIAPPSANVNEPGVVLVPRAFNDGLPDPNGRNAPQPSAPPVAPFSASFKGNTVDGQNKANSTGVYFTTDQLGFGNGNPKVEFTGNTVVNNVDGFFMQTASGFTIETAASFNRIVNNTSTQVTTANLGTLNGSMENNWWGCNAGPNNLGCGNIVGSGIDFNPWIVLGISAAPSTIPPGGSTTVTADMTHNSNNAVPSVTEFVPQVAVTFGAVNGTVFPTSGTITNGQATTTFTSNSTSSGSASATVDNQTVSTPINVTVANTYTWTPTLGTSWILPTNWSPARILPQANDTLIINGTTTPGPTITDVPTQTIAGLHLINGPQVTLQASGAVTLTINGATGSDLTVPAGSFLSLDGSNGITVKVSGLGTMGTVGGGVAAQGGFHRLFGDANGVITFQSGGIGTAGPGLTSNMFGTGAVGDGDAGSVIFASGSIYSHNAGLSPFGTAGNGPVVTFQSGSLARWFSNSGFQASGRTYANLQIGAGLLNAFNVSDSGTGNFQFDNLDIRSTSSANSSLTYNGSGTAAITIRGNITSTGAGDGGTLPDLILTPGSGGTHINKNGGGTLILNATGNARAVDLEGGATVASGTTLSLGRVVLLGLSNPHLNTLNVATGADITGGPTGYVVGSLSRAQVPTGSSIFPVGTTGAYSPVDLANASGGGSLTVAARTPQQPVLAPATSLQRYWSLTMTGSLTTDLTFHYLDGDVNGNESNYRLVIVESGNATSFPDNCPNTCVDESANTIHRSGVTTFSDWTAAEPAAPTAVKLTGFSAVRSGDEVKLQWQSGYEAANLGYNIYREQDGKRVAITPSLVAGSALVAGRQSQLTAGLSYAWYDRLGEKAEGTRQKVESSRRSAVDGQPLYWLEDVDLNGTRTLHGPIAIAECGMGNADCQKLSERSRLLGELSNQQSAVSHQQSAGGVRLSSWPAATLAPDARTNEPDPTEMQRTIAGMPALKVSVSRSGWYRITQPEVLAAGLNIADANGLQLYRDGRQVAFRLSNSAEQFGPADYLEFYGEGLNSATTAAQIYYLVKLGEPGLRVEVKEKNVGPGDRVNPQGFAYTAERKERMIYFSGLVNGDAENFFGQVVSNTAATAGIPVSHLDSTSQSAGTPAQLEVVLQGVTNQSHLVQVRFNGADLGTINFANTDHPSQTFSVPAGAMHDGNNTVELTSLGGAADVSLVDAVRLTYVRAYVADNNALAFNLDSRQTKRLTGFTNEHIRVVDVTDPNEPVELTPEILPDGGGFAALIGVDKEVRAPFSRPHKLIAFVDGQADSVDAIGSNEPSSLWSETAGADYVMITTAALKASIEPLAQLRRNQGMIVQVVDVEDLYDEFTFGEHSPRAIHDYLATAIAGWTRKPHYLLLAGDASYDPKNYTGQGTNDLVPTKLIDTALQETASDDWLADFNSDGMADISVGRLPTRTAGETSALVAKIAGYESAAPDPSRGALLVADNSFEAPSSAVQSLLPSGMPVATVNRSSADDATIRNQIIAALNQGPLVANYLGHGSNGVWTGASLLSSGDAPTLTNTNRLSVFTMMTCFNGFFQDAYNDSLSEALLKAPAGAVAVWASTTLTEPGGQNAIDQEFYRLLFAAQPATLGDAARAAKVVTTDADVRRTWTLFGDPAMRLR